MRVRRGFRPQATFRFTLGHPSNSSVQFGGNRSAMLLGGASRLQLNDCLQRRAYRARFAETTWDPFCQFGIVWLSQSRKIVPPFGMEADVRQLQRAQRVPFLRQGRG